MIEAYTSLENEIRLYGNEQTPGPQIPFNFELISYMHNTSTATDFKKAIDSWMDMLPEGQRANWVVSNANRQQLICKQYD